MLTVYKKYCDQEERRRIEKIELLDEFEEWNMMMAHYFISLAVRSSQGAQQNEKLTQLS